MSQVTPERIQRWRRALELRQDGRLLREIGAELGVSKERARQFVLRAERILRRYGSWDAYEAAVVPPEGVEPPTIRLQGGCSAS